MVEYAVRPRMYVTRTDSRKPRTMRGSSRKAGLCMDFFGARIIRHYITMRWRFRG